MKFILWLIVALVSCIDGSAAAAAVVEVTDASVDKTLGSGGQWLLLVYADWCGHCRVFKPEFERLAALLEGSSSLDGVRLAKANIDLNPGIASRFFVAYLPTIYHIVDRQVRTIDFSDPIIKNINGGGKISAETLFALLEGEHWNSIRAWSWFFSPWNIVALTVGMMGQMVGFLHNSVKYLGGLFPFLNQDALIVGMVVSMLLSVLYVLFCTVSSKDRPTVSSVPVVEGKKSR